MEKEISTDRMITINYDIFKALDDPIRGKIVELLNKKQLNVEQITRRLKKLGSSTRLLDFTLQDDFDEKYSKIISKTSLKLAKVIGPILKNFPKTRKIQQINDNNYIVMEIMNRSLTNLLEKK